MLQSQPPALTQQWQKGNQVWDVFTRRRPELGLPADKSRSIPRPPQPSQFVRSQKVRCGSLLAHEHLHLHGTLPTETIEKLLVSEELLLEVVDALKELLPALEWHPETIPATDLALLERVKQALQALIHSR